MPTWPPGTGYLKDQIRRASSSVVLNIAEGSGKTSPRDQARFYAIARGSMQEVGAAVDVATALGLVSEADGADHQREILAIVKMLTRLMTVTRGPQGL